MNIKENTITSRPPVVVVMGHIDHGKSTLLDYIRKSNVVDSETGGITQRISAYEVLHKDETGEKKKITFLDTPGHEAFSKMRERGAMIADIAILVVSAEDGVKPQTLEAWKTVVDMKLPAIVAINKIDKPGANVEKTKMELAEHEIYLENYGGKIPYVEISAKVGTGVDSLLSLILLIAEVENIAGIETGNASGYILEANLDSKRGMQATMLIKEGVLKKGMTVVTEHSICSTRMIENFTGSPVDEAHFSSPVRIFGFDKMPRVGAEFKSFENKKDAIEYAEKWQGDNKNETNSQNTEETGKKIIAVIVKADVSGSLEAIEKEISKIKTKSIDGVDDQTVEFKIIAKGVGPITERDMKSITTAEDTIIIGFNVKADATAVEIAENRGIKISFFEIIYKMSEWLETEMEARRPRVETNVVIGKAKILRAFSRTKERQIVGGRVLEGGISLNAMVKITRRDFEIGRGKIVNLEKGKVKTSEVNTGTEFGMMIESKIEIAEGDVIESFSVVHK
ncbi:MAG: translation initiation factor IF-2 [Patescibacteria group bacterium]